MILAWVLLAGAWSSLVLALDLTGLFLPDLTLTIAAWAGLRVLRDGQGMNLVVALGLTQGLFSIEPWFLPALLGLLALGLTQSLSRSLSPRSLTARGLLVLAALAAVALLEIVLRMSVPSLNLGLDIYLSLAARAAASTALSIVLDGLTPRR